MVSVLKDIHDDIDRAVFQAYGWADLGAVLIGKPGATAPSLHRTQEQEDAEEELLHRLVALNGERVAEERQGNVRWLRSDYQIPKLSHKVKKPQPDEQTEANLVLPGPSDGKPAWPKDRLDQIIIVRNMLSNANAPVAPEHLSTAFRGRNTALRTKRVQEILQTLIAAGVAQESRDAMHRARRFFILR